jgi:hypothetical protein
MKVFWSAKQKIPALIVSIGLILFCLLIFLGTFINLTDKARPDGYETIWIEDGEYQYSIERLNRNAYLPGINRLLIEAGFIQSMGIAFLIFCILPVFWILKDYHGTRSIRTIMRLPVSPTWYYLDKLLPALLGIASYWIIQLLTLYIAVNNYLKAYPKELRSTDIYIPMWKSFPCNLLYPFSDPMRLPAALTFTILLPAVVILSVFAVKSGMRGILSCIIACGGFLTAIFYFLELPVAYWLTPLMTITVILAGIWHINKIKIT